jgi:hypothetical protein
MLNIEVRPLSRVDGECTKAIKLTKTTKEDHEDS